MKATDLITERSADPRSADGRAVLSARGIGKTVKSGESDLVILRDIELAVMPGEAVAIVGASGSGKSTLLAILAGLDTPSVGTVEIDAQDLFALDEDARAELRGRLVGFVSSLSSCCLRCPRSRT
jgi:putative ABC transport system ATP-binding protein